MLLSKPRFPNVTPEMAASVLSKSLFDPMIKLTSPPPCPPRQDFANPVGDSVLLPQTC
jgi:hypothetical protein